MADPTAAERQRRYRAHKRGDHSLCPPGREDCVTPSVTSPVTRDAVTPPPAALDLGTRGRRLWQDVSAAGPDLQPGERVLLEEACRLADRLDQLDRILRGAADDWLRFHSMNDDGSIVKVVVNGALVEVRQQQVALKQLLSELRQSRSGPAARPGAPRRPAAGARSSAGGAAGVPGVADLTARIAARSPQAAG